MIFDAHQPRLSEPVCKGTADGVLTAEHVAPTVENIRLPRDGAVVTRIGRAAKIVSLIAGPGDDPVGGEVVEDGGFERVETRHGMQGPGSCHALHNAFAPAKVATSLATSSSHRRCGRDTPKGDTTMRNKAPNQGTRKQSNAQMHAANPMLNPGDQAARGTPGTGEDICLECHGNGRINGAPCPHCGGGGTVNRAIGGA
jgi:hypothetical protein